MTLSTSASQPATPPRRSLLHLALAAGLALSPVALARQESTPPRNPAQPEPGETIPTPGSRPTTPPPRPGARTGMRPAAPRAQPATPATHAATDSTKPTPEPGPDEVVLPGVAEGIDLKLFVDYVADKLQISVTGPDTVSGTVVFNGPMVVKKDRLLPLLDSLLEQQGFTITQDVAGLYRIIQRDAVPVSFGRELATTRVIPTPTLRPSALSGTLTSQVAGAKMAFLDDLAVIVVTASPRQIQAVADLVENILQAKATQRLQRFPVRNIAASVARDRVIDLISRAPGAQPTGDGGAAQPMGSLNSLSDRITLDAQANALIFRGTESEFAEIEDALAVVDAPNTLTSRAYPAGSSSLSIAQIARQRGLGEVTIIEAAPSTTDTSGLRQPQQPRVQQDTAATQAAVAGGPTMVVDTSRGSILYYGTAEQHAELESLMATFDVKQDEIVIETYRLKHQPAADVATVLEAILTNQQSSTGSPLLGGRGGQSGLGGFQGFFQQQQQGRQGQTGTGSTQTRREIPASFGFSAGDDLFVTADTANNQIIIKAPAKRQGEFARLIDKIDLRRPQVYIEVQIVAVTANDDFHLAVETQLINAGGSGGVVNTNFGISSVPVGGGNVLDPKVIPLSIAGLTAGIIQSDMVPIVITAIKNETDARIISSPQLLVDDNELAEIVAVEEQPTSSTSQGTATTETSFQGYEQAGTKLSVTPSISEGGYMRLQYDIELSNFVGTATANLPPPKQTRNVHSDSVTIPGDTTIVVGGIRVNENSKTVVKVPLLGDIPILGLLFSDNRDTSRITKLYIFITPRILRDPNFRDLMLLTQGPQAEAEIAPDVPPIQPSVMRTVDLTPPGTTPMYPPPPAKTGSEPQSPPAAPEQRPSGAPDQPSK